MHKKMSGILGMQAGQLIRLGIYTAVVLGLFAAFFPLLGLQVKKGQAALEEDKLSLAVSVPDLAGTEEISRENTSEEAPPREREEAPTNLAFMDNEAKNVPVQVNKGTELVPVKIRDIKWPATGKILREFGLTYSQTFSDYRFHKGIDIGLERGREAAAALDGKVVSVGTSKGEGAFLILDHGSGWQSLYAHLSEVYVQPGVKVEQGQRLGTVDQPGLNEVLEGPHLHFELRQEGQEVNPLDYLPGPKIPS